MSRRLSPPAVNNAVHVGHIKRFLHGEMSKATVPTFTPAAAGRPHWLAEQMAAWARTHGATGCVDTSTEVRGEEATG